MNANDLTYKVRGAIYSVVNELGPGLLESVYEAALKMELEDLGLAVVSQKPIDVRYKNKELGLGFRIDLLVEDLLIIEIKSVESIQNVHLKQLLTNLKLTGKPIGLLVNFNTADMDKNIKRLVNGTIGNQ